MPSEFTGGQSVILSLRKMPCWAMATQYFATVKGIPVDYHQSPDWIPAFITSGSLSLNPDHIPYAVVGQGVAYFLSVGLNFTDPIHIYTLKKGTRGRPDFPMRLYTAPFMPPGSLPTNRKLILNMYWFPLTLPKNCSR